MASTGWTYYCPYEPDAEVALQQLRNDVFSRCEYALPSDLLKDMNVEVLKNLELHTADLKRIANVNKRIHQAMNRFFAASGHETVDDDKETRELEEFIENIEKKGAAAAVRSIFPSTNEQLPKTIDQAREIAGESGTHSILDIDQVSNSPGFGIATPLKKEELITLFGTVEPSLEMAKYAAREGKLIALRESWEAAYFTVFSDGKPDQYVFSGHSGD